MKLNQNKVFSHYWVDGSFRKETINGEYLTASQYFIKYGNDTRYLKNDKSI